MPMLINYEILTEFPVFKMISDLIPPQTLYDLQIEATAKYRRKRHELHLVVRYQTRNAATNIILREGEFPVIHKIVSDERGISGNDICDVIRRMTHFIEITLEHHYEAKEAGVFCLNYPMHEGIPTHLEECANKINLLSNVMERD